MGILSDRQIEAEVKITPMADGGKRPGVISYGLTSYGYDVRLGYKFKVFDVIGGTVIDPKAFDPKALREIDLTAGEHDWTDDGFCRHCGHTVFPGPDQVTSRTACSKRKGPDHLLIPPHSFVLGESLEHFDIPRNLLCVVVGKSTYARCGLIVNVTPGEPEWQGHWTIELSNTTPLPIKVYPGEGIMQCLFFRSDEVRDAGARALQQTCNYFGNTSPCHYQLSAYRKELEQASCGVSYKDKKGKYQGQGGLTLPKVEGA